MVSIVYVILTNNFDSFHFTGHLKIMKILFKNGAKPNLTDNDGRTALFNAASSGIFNIQNSIRCNETYSK